MKKCTIGYNCGNSCIRKSNDCVVDLSKVAGSTASMVKAKIEEANQIATKKEHSKVNKDSIKAAGVTKEQLNSIKEYTKASKIIRYLEAGNSLSETKVNEEGVRKDIDNINKFLDNPQVPSFNKPIYSGFKADMGSAYGLDSLRVGTEFSFPSMTSFSSDSKMASSFNGGGKFVIKNNKSGKSIDALSAFVGIEMEVLVPKKAKYKVANVTKETSPYGNLVNVYQLEEI